MSDNTIKCAISEVEKRCRIEIVLDSGSNRTEFLVKVLKEGICDANGPSPRLIAHSLDRMVVTDLIDLSVGPRCLRLVSTRDHQGIDEGGFFRHWIGG